MRKLWLALLLVLATAPCAGADSAASSCVAASVPDAQLVGEGRMTYMMMPVYDARLYAPDGKLRNGGSPLALSLTYLRALRGNRIADRTIEEMRGQGFEDEVTLAAWHDTLRKIFPDVEQGTVLTGVLTREGATLFCRGDEEIGRVEDPAFGRRFFAIWLGAHSSDPDLRAELLHQNS